MPRGPLMYRLLGPVKGRRVVYPIASRLWRLGLFLMNHGDAGPETNGEVWVLRQIIKPRLEKTSRVPIVVDVGLTVR